VTKDSSKIFILFYIPLGVTMVLAFCTELVRTVLTDAQDEIIQRFYSWRRGYVRELSTRELSRGRVVLSVAAVLICLFSGMLFFDGNEDWGLLNSFYWSLCIMTTIGYGVSPVVS
jgi:hypothetical protein